MVAIICSSSGRCHSLPPLLVYILHHLSLSLSLSLSQLLAHASALGVFGFYLAQLAPVIQYKDLRTDVFQAFKDLGNTVIFCLLLEKALV